MLHNILFRVAHDFFSTRESKNGFVCPTRRNKIHFKNRQQKNPFFYPPVRRKSCATSQVRSYIRPNTGPASANFLPKIDCQSRDVIGMITPVCTWRPILAQTLAAKTCFRHSNGPMLCRTLVFSLPEWFAVVKVTHGPESGSSTFGIGFHSKSDNRLGIGPILGKFRLKFGNFEQSTKAAVVCPALDRCKRRNQPNNNKRLLAVEIRPILCRIISFGNSHLGLEKHLFYSCDCFPRFARASNFALAK